MIKIKNIFSLLFIGVVVMYSCDDDIIGNVNPFANVDYEELAKTENDSILKFLKTHYYKANSDFELDSFEFITNDGQTSLFDDGKLKDTIITRNNIAYTLYTYVHEQGSPNAGNDKGFPSTIDSLFVNYTRNSLINNSLSVSFLPNSNSLDIKEQFWLPNTIIGFAAAATHFKGGNNETNNGPITYTNTGKGYFFIPSGLAYPSINFQFGFEDPNGRPYDQTLIFKFELLDIVQNTDHDNDGKPSINEDTNGDKDPTNDFSDKTNPNVPDFLNPNVN
ncbi:peptidylprolyl isomerase [uncultured Polaribacter sp.]|uniref:peptidylprolyl isomerase n=1 Tax=uncultured Polaribacter sp. TaxID=174711 RepID=UPI00262E5B10|nr:peptidylprolyl isomerase [uncultured Polaribacter sp.]